jgi:hypothetical protein
MWELQSGTGNWQSQSGTGTGVWNLQSSGVAAVIRFFASIIG